MFDWFLSTPLPNVAKSSFLVELTFKGFGWKFIQKNTYRKNSNQCLASFNRPHPIDA